MKGVKDKLPLINTVLIGFMLVTMLVGGNDPLGGTRFPSGISADSTSPSAGQVRGTTLTSTGAATLASASITGAATVGTTLGVTGASTFADIVNWEINVASTSADVVLTAAQSGRTIFISTTAATTTLPAVTNAGAWYRIQIGLNITADAVVVSAEGDNINGSLFVNSALVVCDGEDQIKFINDGETIGDYVVLYSDGTLWQILESRGETAGKLTCVDPV